MSYKKDYEIGLEDIGKGNLATNIAILKMLEEVAEQNSSEVGLGIENMDDTKLAWLLLDWKFEIIKRPKYREKISIETWSRKLERCYGYRDFEVYDDKKELIARGSSKWVVIDIERGKPVRLEEKYAMKYAKYDKGYSVFEDEIEKMEEIPETDLIYIRNYEVQRRDIDVNKHMHNISYLELAYEVLPYDIYTEDTFNNVRIAYKKEIKYGDNVKCYYSNKNNKHIITIKTNEIDSEPTSQKTNAIIELY